MLDIPNTLSKPQFLLPQDGLSENGSPNKEGQKTLQMINASIIQIRERNNYPEPMFVIPDNRNTKRKEP